MALVRTLWLFLLVFIPGTFWFGRFDVKVKIGSGEKANVDIALAMARPAYSSGKLDDEARDNFNSQKTVKIKRTGYTSISARSQDSGMEVIKQRIVTDLVEVQVEDQDITAILEGMTSEGNWPDIDYTDTSRTGFQHGLHLSRMVEMAISYRQVGSHYYQNPEVTQALSNALDFWLNHDFICENWWWNQIGTPRALVNVLLLMEDELTHNQVTKTVRIIDRSNLQASGARPSGDRIKMAGILAKKLLITADRDQFEEVMEVIEGEIKFSEERGMQVDYSFHHRKDRVNNTLSYGLGYAQAFAEWAALVSGTEYQFSEPAIHQLVDYFLDGICKMSIYGKYPDPGAKNRSVSRSGTLHAYGTEMIDHLLASTDYRRDELRDIRAVRTGNQKPQREFNKFFWQTEYMSHQREDFFTSARMYSTRNQNMEYPYNSEGIKNHYLGDGANFISRTGREYYNIFPVLDWRRIPGTTVVQKPGMPSEEEIREEGVTDFVGGVSDGLVGSAAFDYVKQRDSLTARKSWFFFDDSWVCLGAGISSASVFPVNTTLNQSLLNGDVYVSTEEQVYPIRLQSQTKKEGLIWVWHDSVGYIFPSPTDVQISNQTQSGSWYDINRQSDTPRELIEKDVFKLWIDHGTLPQNAQYSYIVVPSVSITDIETRDYTDFIKVLTNNRDIQAVQHRLDGIVQAVFYEPGKLAISNNLIIELEDAGMIMIKYRNGGVLSATVSDPSRKLSSLRFSISQQLKSPSDGVKLQWDEAQQKTDFTVDLPQDSSAGSSVVVTF